MNYQIKAIIACNILGIDYFELKKYSNKQLQLIYTNNIRQTRSNTKDLIKINKSYYFLLQYLNIIDEREIIVYRSNNYYLNVVEEFCILFLPYIIILFCTIINY